MPIKIISKKDGFRRAGLAHSGTAVYPDNHFTAAQLAALQAEPHLVVEVLAAPKEEKAEKTGAPAEKAGDKAADKAADKDKQ